MKKSAFAIVLLASLGAFATSTRADVVLGSGGYAYNCAGVGIHARVEFRIQIGTTTILDAVLSNADSGATFVIDSGPVFDDAVAQLTDGLPTFIEEETVGFPDGGGCGSAQAEEGFFAFEDCVSGVDFQGAEIDRIEVFIANLEIRPSGFSEWDVDVEITVFGECPECFLVLGRQAGSSIFSNGSHSWNVQVDEVFESYPVLLDDLPAFPIPEVAPPAGGPGRGAYRFDSLWPIARVYAQVVMYNPGVFPDLPEQWTNGLELTLWSNAEVTARPYGARQGMDLWLEAFVGEDGGRYVHLPFRIDGIPGR